MYIIVGALGDIWTNNITERIIEVSDCNTTRSVMCHQIPKIALTGQSKPLYQQNISVSSASSLIVPQYEQTIANRYMTNQETMHGKPTTLINK